MSGTRITRIVVTILFVATVNHAGGDEANCGTAS